ncbi:MAG: aminotransferase class I/II-fold pyridoxal phosphate-dependent enzyme [Pseudohongiellaceae bacterium]
MQKTKPHLAQVNPFRVMSVMQRAGELERAGRHIIHFEVGEPDFTTPRPIIEAAKRALDEGLTQYTQAAGIRPLQEAIAQRYLQCNGVTVAPERIFVTPGASGGLLLLAHKLVSAGDGVLMTDPAYPCVRNLVHLQSGIPQLVAAGMERNFQPTVADLAARREASSRGVWLASPANPAGTVIERDELTTICNWAQEQGLHILMDEIYHGLHYTDGLPSVLELEQGAYVVNSFSKYFGMTGWRLGWIVVPEAAVEQTTILAQNLFISAPSIAQYAALAAFKDDTIAICEERRAAFRQRRDYLCTALAELGFGLPPRIEGAFYVYADISRFADDCEQFCRQMLEEHGVALTPGTDFGEHQARRYVRFAFTTSMENLEEGVARMARAL